MSAPADPVEIELKLAIDPAAAAAVRAHPAVRALACGRARIARVDSTYFDTADRRLRRASVALRVRRDGRRWLMTVKGAAPPATETGIASRPEYEWTTGGAGIDAMRLATTPWRALFAKALRKGGLAPAFTTTFARTSVPLAFPDGTTATLAIDVGHIEAGGRAAARATEARIAEIELELLEGEPRRLLDLAGELAADLPLAIEPRSKAERGYAIADGVRAEPSRAREIEHAAGATAHAAIAAIAAECVRQIGRNAIGFRARALADPEWIHQMRIGVRRLRSCLALADGVVAPETLERLRGETRWALDTLGPARDLDVFALETLPAALRDLAGSGRGSSAGAEALATLARRASARRRSAHAAAAACVSSPRFTRFVLAASGLALAGAATGDGDANGGPAEPALRFAARLLERRARRLAKAVDRIGRAGVDERHAIRIAAKKLRYATEFFAALFPRKRTRAYRKALALLQDELGAFNDAAVAPRVASVIAGPTAPATVAIEAWSAARAGESARRLDDACRRFASVAPFWKRA